MSAPVTKYRVTDLCTACGLCLDSCPYEGIRDGFSSRGYPKVLIQPGLCTACAVCVTDCPIGAIVEGEQDEDAIAYSS